jgi:hypothetical protein
MQSPLDRALGNRNTALNHVLKSLSEQMSDCLSQSKKAQDNYIFYVDEKDVVAAREEYFTVTCSAEAALDDFVIAHYKDRLVPMIRVFFSKGRCPKSGNLVSNHLRIDEHHDAIATHVLASPDQLLSENYAPYCIPCSKHSPERHQTILSYTRYIDEEHAQFHDKEQLLEQCIGTLQSVNSPTINESVELLCKEKEQAYAALKRRLLNQENNFLFASTRIKGSARLADKIARVLLTDSLQSYVNDRPLPQVADLYGCKVIMQTEQDVEEEAQRLQKLPGVYSSEKVKKPGHECRNFRIMYRDIMIETQVQSYAQFLHDQSTHPKYEEERQLEIEHIASNVGLPASRIMEQLRTVLDYRSDTRMLQLTSS